MTEIDARGLPCPQPIIKTKKALAEMGEGRITVLVDSPESRENVTRFARSEGCEIAVREEAGVFYLDITRGEAVEVKDKSEAVSGDVILITSDQFGVGEARLGEILMKAFLNTLWDYDPKPAKILFINSSVRLSIEGSEVLETLRLLEKKGVQILSCGTCLEYYNLTDKLGVGLVSNMYSTVDALVTAGKVIRV